MALSPRSNSVKSSRFGVDEAAQTRCGDAGKAHRQCAATAGIELCCAALAQHRRTEGIRHHQATFIWDQRARKIVRDGKIKAIREVAVGDPLAVGSEIGHRTLDLDITR